MSSKRTYRTRRWSAAPSGRSIERSSRPWPQKDPNGSCFFCALPHFFLQVFFYSCVDTLIQICSAKDATGEDVCRIERWTFCCYVDLAIAKFWGDHPLAQVSKMAISHTTDIPKLVEPSRISALLVGWSIFWFWIAKVMDGSIACGDRKLEKSTVFRFVEYASKMELSTERK